MKPAIAWTVITCRICHHRNVVSGVVTGMRLQWTWLMSHFKRELEDGLLKYGSSRQFCRRSVFWVSLWYQGMLWVDVVERCVEDLNIV
jgi:hypothetical protein